MVDISPTLLLFRNAWLQVDDEKPDAFISRKELQEKVASALEIPRHHVVIYTEYLGQFYLSHLIKQTRSRPTQRHLS